VLEAINERRDEINDSADLVCFRCILTLPSWAILILARRNGFSSDLITVPLYVLFGCSAT
jgi:hypothetical protein